MTDSFIRSVAVGSALALLLGTSAQNALAHESPEKAFTDLRAALKAGDVKPSKLEGSFEILAQSNWRNTWNQWRNGSPGINS